MNVTKNWSHEKKVELYLELAKELQDLESRDLGSRSIGLISYDEVLAQLKEREKNGTPWGIKTYFPSLDSAFEGLNKGELYVIGAATGVGKSLFVQNIALRAAYDNHKVLFVTTEMTPIENLKRMRQMRSVIEQDNVEGLPVDFNDPASTVTMESIHQTLADHQKLVDSQMVDPYELVIIDNLQYFVRSASAEAEQIGLATRGCKELARQFDLPVLLVSHVRKLNNEERTPEMDDLRGSSFISQDADGVISLWRDKVNLPNQIIASIKKNRRTGKMVTCMLVSDHLILNERLNIASA